VRERPRARAEYGVRTAMAARLAFVLARVAFEQAAASQYFRYRFPRSQAPVEERSRRSAWRVSTGESVTVSMPALSIAWRMKKGSPDHDRGVSDREKSLARKAMRMAWVRRVLVPEKRQEHDLEVQERAPVLVVVEVAADRSLRSVSPRKRSPAPAVMPGLMLWRAVVVRNSS